MFFIILPLIGIAILLTLWFFYRLPSSDQIIRAITEESTRVVDLEIFSPWKWQRIRITGIKGRKTVTPPMPELSACDKINCRFERSLRHYALPRNPGLITQIPSYLFAQIDSDYFMFGISPIMAQADGTIHFSVHGFFEPIQRNARLSTIDIGQFENPVAVLASGNSRFLTYQVQSGNSVVMNDILMLTAANQHKLTFRPPCLDCERYIKIESRQKGETVTVWIPGEVSISGEGQSKRFHIKPVYAETDGIISLPIPDGKRSFWFFDFLVTGQKMFDIETDEFGGTQTFNAEKACNILSFVVQSKTKVKAGDLVMLIAIEKMVNR